MAVTNSGMSLLIDNDNDNNWTGEDGTSNEVFWQGVGSQMWIVGKTATETAILTLAANFSAAKYITFGMLSTISPFYNIITLELESTANNYETFTLADRSQPAPLYRAIAGEFITSSPSIELGQGIETGTYVPGSHTILRITVDNSTSGNIRSVENHYIDAMYYGTGRTIGGTTVSDTLFKESDDLNISGDVLDCCTMQFGGEVFAQTDVLVTTTSGNSYAETLVFREVANTSNVYTLEITGTADFQGSTVKGANTNVTVNFDVSAATSFQMLGGKLANAGTTLLKAGQDIFGVVFTDRTTITHSACNFEGNTINTSGIMTVSSTGTCTGNTFNKPSGVSALLLADLSHAPNNTFVSDGSSHAVELSSIGSGSMDWTGDTTLFDSGSTGSPVTPTSTGNEDIYVNVGAGELTINVSTGATTPSIRSAGATVNVVAGLVTLTFTVSPSIINYEYSIYTVTAVGSLIGAVEVQHVETHASDTFAYTYTYSAGTVLAVQLLFGDGSVNDYEESTTYYELGSSSQSTTINLTKDNNN